MVFQFESLNDFFAMAGHGPYVWWSYGISLLVMLYLIVSPIARSRKQLKLIKLQGAIQMGRAAPKQAGKN